MAKRVRLHELPLMKWGDVVKMNALLDMEDDMQSAYREYSAPPEKKG